MPRVPLPAASAVARSLPLTRQRVVNCFAQKAPQDARTPYALYGTPGQLGFAVGVLPSPIRAMHTGGNGTPYVIAGDGLYTLSSTGTVAFLGSVAIVAGGFITIATSSTQVAVSSAGHGYVGALSGPIAEISDPDFIGNPVSVEHIDGYFLWCFADGRIQVSSLLAGTDYDALDFASAEGAPDGLVRGVADHREAWLFGSDTIEIWYNSGEADFPFRRRDGAFLERGCLAGATIAKLDNSLVWLGNDRIVYKVDQYAPIRVSTHEVELALAESGRADEARAWCYTQEGHWFYVLWLPNRAALVYDAATQLWHERLSYGRDHWSGGAGCMAYGKSLLGDCDGANVYELDLDTYADNGGVLRSEITYAPIYNDGRWMFFRSVQHEMEVGVGLATGQGDAPVAMLSWSDDGRTWSNERDVPIGPIGAYRQRAICHRLGAARVGRSFRWAITDPVKRVFHGATYAATGGG